MNEKKLIMDIDDFDDKDISSILIKWKEVVDNRKLLDEVELMLKTKVKTYLKEKNWNRYLDEETKISVTLNMQKRTNIDKQQLELILTPTQLAQITHTTTFERLNIITPETRDRLKRFIKKK